VIIDYGTLDLPGRGRTYVMMESLGVRAHPHVELCQTASVAQPAMLPMDLTLFVAWLEHSYPDPSLAAVVFLLLRTGWSVAVLCARVR
jgi:hypothetical protein